MGSQFPSPGDLLNPGIEPGSSALQANSLLSESPGQPKVFSALSIFVYPHGHSFSQQTFIEYFLQAKNCSRLRKSSVKMMLSSCKREFTTPQIPRGIKLERDDSIASFAARSYLCGISENITRATFLHN